MGGIERSCQQVRTFMKRYGLRFLKCGLILAKANNENQCYWMKEKLQSAIEAVQKREVHLLFSNAAYFVLQPFICCLWCALVFIKAASGRNRINVIGAVHAISKKVVTLTNTTYITKKFFTKPIIVLLDNARYQHCLAVTSFDDSLGIQLLFLPPYSPNINIIERMLKFTKKQILYSKYYDHPEAFHQAIANFFTHININYKKQL